MKCLWQLPEQVTEQETERMGGSLGLAEPELELGGLVALGEGTRRAGAGMGGAAFCPFLSLRRGG